MFLAVAVVVVAFNFFWSSDLGTEIDILGSETWFL